MHQLLEWVTDHQNKLVLLTVSHATIGQKSYITDASQKVILRRISLVENSYKIEFSEPSNFTSAINVSINAPVTAKVEPTDDKVAVTYDSQNTEVKLELVDLEMPRTAQKTSENDEAYVREIKNLSGEVKRIIIHLPADTVDMHLLETANAVLNQLLLEWKFISVAKRSAAQLVMVHNRVKVDEVTLVYLPGDSFFQLSGKDNKDTITLDISLEIFINLERKSISFTFENVTYELVKIS